MLPLVLAVVGAGCATFSDNDAVARVNDTELTRDEFEQQLADQGVTDQDVILLEPARAEITRWIQSVVIDDDQVAAIYDAGPAVSGVVCLKAVVVPDAAAADSAVDQLGSGTSFEAVFEAANIDPTIAGDLGTVPCITSEGLEASESVPLIQAALQLSASDVLGSSPLIDQSGEETGYAVIVFRPYFDLGPADLEVVNAAVDVSSEIAEADIYVDPRYGTFDKTIGQVISLG